MHTSIKVITDSAADLPKELAIDHGIAIVPLTVRFGDSEFTDGESLTAAEFWRQLDTSEHLPETAPPLPYRFEQEIKEAANNGATGVVIVCMSSTISATYESAVLAAEAAAGTVAVKVVDSRTLSMVQGFAALAAAEAAAGGRNIDQVANAAVHAAANANLIATLDTLEFLERGGRVGQIGTFFGNLLNVKPLLTLEDGVVVAAGRVRSRRTALDTIAEHVLGLPSLAELAVVHGNAPDIEYLLEAVAPRVARDRIVISELGPVLATHTGPGVVGVAYRSR